MKNKIKMGALHKFVGFYLNHSEAMKRFSWMLEENTRFFVQSHRRQLEALTGLLDQKPAGGF